MYLVPPKLQKKFLVGLWTFWELLVVAGLVFIFAYSNWRLLFIPATILLGSARMDLENSIVTKIVRCLKFYLQCNTYKLL